MEHRGIFISFEGIDGAGKTTLIHELTKRFEKEHRLVQTVREPGGTTTAEKIRTLLLDAKNTGILPKTEALLYSAARIQLVEEVIKPALNKGMMVFADRYMDSTIAYQGYGRGIDITFLHLLNQFCSAGIMPEVTFLLDVEPEAAQARRVKRDYDRLEQEGMAFQEKVRAGYLLLARQNPNRIQIVDGAQSPVRIEQQVARAIMEII